MCVCRRFCFLRASPDAIRPCGGAQHSARYVFRPSRTREGPALNARYVFRLLRILRVCPHYTAAWRLDAMQLITSCRSTLLFAQLARSILLFAQLARSTLLFAQLARSHSCSLNSLAQHSCPLNSLRSALTGYRSALDPDPNSDSFSRGYFSDRSARPALHYVLLYATAALRCCFRDAGGPSPV